MREVIAFAALIVAGIPLWAQAEPLVNNRVEADGFSFAPPHEFGWRTQHLAPSWIHLERLGSETDETLFIDVRRVRFPSAGTPDNLQRFSRAYFANANPQRFNVIRTDISADHLATGDCAYTYTLIRDRAPVRHSGATTPMLMEGATLICATRKSPNEGVVMMYSERHDDDGPDPTFRERSGEVLRTLELR